MTLENKYAHVQRALMTRDHDCHGGCGRKCKPAHFSCPTCWRRLPVELKRAIWRTYQAGQEEGRAPVTREYLAAATAAQRWLIAHPELRNRGMFS